MAEIKWKAKTKNGLLREALLKTADYLKKKNADGSLAIQYLDQLKEWYNAPETQDSGTPGGPPPPPPGGGNHP